MIDLAPGFYWLADRDSRSMEVAEWTLDRKWAFCGSDVEMSLGQVAEKYAILPVPVLPVSTTPLKDLIRIDWRYQFAGGVLVGIPIGNLLGNWSAFIWLPLGMWAMYRIWKDQQ